MLRRAIPAGWAESVWWEVKKRLKKGIVSREAVGKANPIIPRLVAYVIRPRSYVYLSVFNLVHFST
jgi:hypothetical protein